MSSLDWNKGVWLACDDVEDARDEVVNGVMLGAGGQNEEDVADDEHEAGDQEEGRWLGYRVWVNKFTCNYFKEKRWLVCLNQYYYHRSNLGHLPVELVTDRNPFIQTSVQGRKDSCKSIGGAEKDNQMTEFGRCGQINFEHKVWP